MPKVVVDDYGGKRTDPGMLGHGIYFASSARCVSRVRMCTYKSKYLKSV